MAQQEIHNTSGLPDQVKSLTLYDLAEYLGPLQQHGSEGQGYQCECPICYRNTLHLTPGVDASKAKIWCYYCHGEPRRKLIELGYGDVIDSTRHVVDHGRIKRQWDYWWYSTDPRIASHPLIGSVADQYLQSRGIDVRYLQPRVCDQIKCCPWAWYNNRFRAPAMIAKAYSLFGGDTFRPATIHVTFLREDGSGKADVPVPKRTHGSTSGAAIYFGPSETTAETATWVIGEGIETTLSAMTMLRDSGEHGPYGPPGIVALSSGGLRWLDLPLSIKRVIIAADNDVTGVGERAAKILQYRLRKAGKFVSIALPPKVRTDWNDVLVANQRSGALR